MVPTYPDYPVYKYVLSLKRFTFIQTITNFNMCVYKISPLKLSVCSLSKYTS